MTEGENMLERRKRRLMPFAFKALWLVLARAVIEAVSGVDISNDTVLAVLILIGVDHIERRLDRTASIPNEEGEGK